MGSYDELITRLEKLENYVYNEVEGLIKEKISKMTECKEENNNESSNLIKYKASKHKKAYRPERIYKNRCYIK